MVVMLLILIVLTLLFGACAVKGWLRGLALYLIGGVLLVSVSLLLSSWLGEDGPLYFFGGLGVLPIIARLAIPDEDSPRVPRSRKRAADAAWAKWEEENRVVEPEPEPFKRSTVVLSKEEKKQLTREYLDQQSSDSDQGVDLRW